MPVYVYEVIEDDGSAGERFEVVQSMRDDPLSTHPVSGKRVRKLVLAPNIAAKYTPGQTAKRLSNDNIAKAGFTKYERDKLTGRYHRVAGKDGPPTIERG